MPSKVSDLPLQFSAGPVCKSLTLSTCVQVTLAVHAKELGQPVEPTYSPQLQLNATGEAGEAAAREASELDAMVMGSDTGLSHRGTHP